MKPLLQAAKRSKAPAASPPSVVEPAPRTSVRIEEVARHAGVSPATVSRVVNGRGKCSVETRDRVMAVITELGYVPNTAAKNLAQGRTGNIGLLLPNVSTDFMSSLVQVIATTAAEANYDVLLSVRPEGSLRRMLGRHNTDGVLIFGGYAREEEIRQLAAQRCPAVLMYQLPPDGLSLPSITIDNGPGAQALVNHLIGVHGRRRIAYLRGRRESDDSVVRERGYRRALSQHGIKVDERLFRNGMDADAARAATLDLLRAEVDFDAIFAWCDNAAAGAIDALRSAGKAVPADVAVVGFDDAPTARFLDPALTTIHAPTDRVGQHAVRELVTLIETGAAERAIRLPVEMIVRRSCGCAGAAPA